MKLAPVYDDRATMSQYNRCDCGRMKGRYAKQCARCYSLHRRQLDYLKQLRRGDASKA